MWFWVVIGLAKAGFRPAAVDRLCMSLSGVAVEVGCGVATVVLVNIVDDAVHSLT